MNIMNNAIQVEGWRPKLPTMFYKTLKALICDCWEHDPDDRPDFDEIVRRLNGEVREEVWMKPEPDFVCDENFLKNSVDYEENEGNEEEEEYLVMLKQSYSDLLLKLEQQLSSAESKNADFIGQVKDRRADVEHLIEQKQEQRRAASEQAAFKGQGGRPAREKNVVGAAVAPPLPDMLASFRSSDEGGDGQPTMKLEK